MTKQEQKETFAPEISEKTDHPVSSPLRNPFAEEESFSSFHLSSFELSAGGPSREEKSDSQQDAVPNGLMPRPVFVSFDSNEAVFPEDRKKGFVSFLRVVPIVLLVAVVAGLISIAILWRLRLLPDDWLRFLDELQIKERVLNVF